MDMKMTAKDTAFFRASFVPMLHRCINLNNALMASSSSSTTDSPAVDSSTNEVDSSTKRYKVVRMDDSMDSLRETSMTTLQTIVSLTNALSMHVQAGGRFSTTSGILQDLLLAVEVAVPPTIGEYFIKCVPKHWGKLLLHLSKGSMHPEYNGWWVSKIDKAGVNVYGQKASDGNAVMIGNCITAIDSIAIDNLDMEKMRKIINKAMMDTKKPTNLTVMRFRVQREGKCRGWWPEETRYKDKMVSLFKAGQLGLPPGFRLFWYLAFRLQCSYERIARNTPEKNLKFKQMVKGDAVESAEKETKNLAETFRHKLVVSGERGRVF
jgi:hypothetical protein